MKEKEYHYYTKCQGNSTEITFFKQIVMEQLDICIWVNGPLLLADMIHRDKFEMDHRCKIITKQI